MCRGANLGVCCAQGCDDRIRCQDTGGYCDAHAPYIDWDPFDDDGDEVGVVRDDPVDDPEKRRLYTLNRLTRGIATTEASIEADQRRLAAMRARVRDLEQGPVDAR